MKSCLDGKVAIVTGAGRDIGRACAIALAQAGAAVAVNYHSSAAGAHEVVETIEREGGRAFMCKGDMTKREDADTLVRKTVEAYGGVDIVLHNTGGMLARKSIADMDLDHWRGTIDLNVTSLLLIVKAALPHLKRGSAIVTMASDAGRDGGGPHGVAYAASKGAVMTMTRAMAKELAPDIRVNALCPGAIATQLPDTFTSPQTRAATVQATPLKREGTSGEVANAAVFLASDHASFMTGACVDINGGILFS